MTRKRTLPALALGALALLLTACAGAPVGNEAPPPTEAEGILERAREAMGEVTSARYTVTNEIEQDGRVSRNETLNEWAGPDRYRATTTWSVGTERETTVVSLRIDQATYGPAPDSQGWARRVDVDWSPPQKTGLSGLLPDLVAPERLADSEADGVPVFRLSGEGRVDPDFVVHVPPGQPPSVPSIRVTLYIGQEDFLVRRMVTETQVTVYSGRPDGTWEERVQQTRTVHEFFDFNEPITIQPPEEWTELPPIFRGPPPPPPTATPHICAPAATLVFELAHEVEAWAWEELLRIARQRLEQGAWSVQAERTGDRELTVRLPANSLHVEHATALLERLGRFELVERLCNTARCDRPDEYEDRPTNIDDRDIAKVVVHTDRLAPDRYVLLVELEPRGAVRLAEVSQRIYATNTTASPNQLAMVLDGEVLIAAGVRSPILAGSFQVDGDLSLEQAQEEAVLLSYGRLPVELSLVRVEE